MRRLFGWIWGAFAGRLPIRPPNRRHDQAACASCYLERLTGDACPDHPWDPKLLIQARMLAAKTTFPVREVDVAFRRLARAKIRIGSTAESALELTEMAASTAGNLGVPLMLIVVKLIKAMDV